MSFSLFFRFLLLTCLLCVIKNPSAFRAYDCFNRNANYTTISLTHVSPCPTIEEDKINVIPKQVQIVQEKLWRMFHVYHCNIVVTKLITHCGMHSHASVVRDGFKNTIVELNRDQCIQVHIIGRLQYGGQLIKEISPNTTHNINLVTAGVLLQDGTCIGETINTPEGTFLNAVSQVIMKISLKDYDTLFEIDSQSLVFNDGTTCSLTKSPCIHSVHGHTFWKISKHEDCSSSSRDVIYEGPGNFASISDTISIGDVLSINQGTSLFALTVTSVSHVCHQRAFGTEHPRLFIIIKERFGFYFVKEKVINQNVDLTAYMNAKIALVSHQTENMIKKIYKELTYRDCEIERLALINRLAIIRHHPMSFGHVVDGSPGYFSVVAGEVLHMMKCQPVDVTVRKSSKCTSNLPVIYGNNSMFMEPVAKILTNTSMEIPCSMLTPSKYEIGGNWYNFIPSPVLSSSPITLSPSFQESSLKFENMAKLVTSGLYDADTMEAFKHFMSFPLIKQDTNNYITAKLTGSELYTSDEYSSSMLLNDYDVKQKVMAGLKKFFGFMFTFGSVAGAIWGVIMCYKLITTLMSVVINAVSLHKAYGCGIHILASMLDALTHLVFRMKPERDEGKGKHDDAENDDVELGIVIPKHIQDQPGFRSDSTKAWLDAQRQRTLDM